MKPFSLDEYLKTPSRNVVTRSGKPVIIHCTNYESDGPIIAEVKGYNKSRSYQRNGRYYLYDDSNFDLFFAPEKHEGWISIYQGKDGPITGNVIFTSKEEAEESKSHCCGFTKDLYITSVKIEWED